MILREDSLGNNKINSNLGPLTKRSKDMTQFDRIRNEQETLEQITKK